MFGISAASVRAATFTVDTLTDDATKTACTAAPGDCSLRGAIATANATPGDDVISFSVTGNIILDTNGALPDLNSNVTIDGPGATKLTVKRDAGATAFRIFAIGSNATVSISGISISGGSADLGGGIINYGHLTINNSAVVGNHASTGGGGIFNDGRADILVGELTITNSTLTGNSSGNWGGGVLTWSAALSIQNSTISGNSSGFSGGAIDYDSDFEPDEDFEFNGWCECLMINNSTITANNAGAWGGAIFQRGGIILMNSSIVAKNLTSFRGPNITGDIYGGDHNLIDNTTDLGTLPGSNNIVGVDPHLGPLQNNGGPTKTHALLFGSPAVDTGSNPLDLATDQRLTVFTRVVGAAADIGAFEVQPACLGVSFSLATNYAAGGGQHSVTTGDFNNDGKLDLAAAVGGSDVLSILLGNGDGTFGPATYLPVGDQPWLVKSADLDGDGNLDLAVSNSISTDVSVRLGNGDGTFGPVANFEVGQVPNSLAVADFNGDGHLDLATPNSVLDSISVLIGNGNGTFADATDFAAGNFPNSITASDFNGDGNIDVVTANQLSNDVTVLFGNGDGTFDPPMTFGVGTAPWFVIAADLNGDGNFDLVTANNESDNVSILLGNGNGTFISATNIAVGDGPQSVTAADLDGDGNLDLAVAVTGLSKIAALLGNGDGTFGPPADFATGKFPRGVTAADLNQDGKIDLVTANVGSGDLSVLLNSCSADTAPTVTNVTSTTANGTYGVGTIIPIQITFSENVTVTGTPLLTLETGATDAIVTYAGGSGTDTLTFSYAVAAGHASADLDYVSSSSLSLNGGTIKDAANNAILTLPAPGAAGSLGANKNIVIDTTPPTADDDSYTIAEDGTLNVPAGTGVLAGDTNEGGGPLTAVLVNGPFSGTLTLNADGSFSYKPNANFNGSDLFTYKANDGSLDSNVATVTITVNPVNDAPVASATPNSQSVQYSDPISAVTVTASDIDSTTLTATTTFKVGAGAFGNGLPSGLSLASPVCAPSGSGTGCQWTLSGKANVAAGTYVIRVTVSDAGLSASSDVTLIVNKEKTETIYNGDVFMFTAGPTVTTANVRLSAQLTQEADGNAGDITKAKVSFLLFKSSNLSATPDLTVTGVPVDAAGAALKSVNLGVDTWTIKVKIDADNGYWKASPVGMGTVTVEQPTNELRTSGGGWVADAQSMNGKGNFGFNVANQKKGVRGGSVYLFRGLDGFIYLVKNTSWQSGGIGFSAEGAILSKAAFSGKCVLQKIDSDTGEVVDSFGNYSFTVDVSDGDLFNPRQVDKYAITVLNSNGLVWRQIGSRTNPPAIGGGNITVKAK